MSLCNTRSASNSNFIQNAPLVKTKCIIATTAVALLALVAIVIGIMGIHAFLHGGLGNMCQLGWQGGTVFIAVGITGLVTIIIINLVRYCRLIKQKEEENIISNKLDSFKPVIEIENTINEQKAQENFNQKIDHQEEESPTRIASYPTINSENNSQNFLQIPSLDNTSDLAGSEKEEENIISNKLDSFKPVIEIENTINAQKAQENLKQKIDHPEEELPARIAGNPTKSSHTNCQKFLQLPSLVNTRALTENEKIALEEILTDFDSLFRDPNHTSNHYFESKKIAPYVLVIELKENIFKTLYAFGNSSHQIQQKSGQSITLSCDKWTIANLLQDYLFKYFSSEILATGPIRAAAGFRIFLNGVENDQEFILYQLRGGGIISIFNPQYGKGMLTINGAIWDKN